MFPSTLETVVTLCVKLAADLAVQAIGNVINKLPRP
jgi:hypothetical protein